MGRLESNITVDDNGFKNKMTPWLNGVKMFIMHKKCLLLI